MNWNNVYNKDHTNPYSSISTVMSSGHFPLVEEDKAERIKVSAGFNTSNCFQQKYRNHQITECDNFQQDRNYETNGLNLYPYAHYILDECDEKKFTDAWKVVMEAGFNVQWDVFMQEVALPMAKLIKERGGADGERTGK